MIGLRRGCEGRSSSWTGLERHGDQGLAIYLGNLNVHNLADSFCRGRFA